MASGDDPEVLVQLRRKHAIPVNGKPPPVNSTVGLVLDGAAVTMVVPGGPAYKPANGKKIEKTGHNLTQAATDLQWL